MTEENTASDRIRSHNAKIAIIGGGSPYCAGLMRSITQMGAQLRGCHIVLMDINEEGLELIYTLGSKMFRHAEVELTLERTTSQEEALTDADFVLTAFRTGGMEARRLDEKIPLRHGLIAQEAGVGAAPGKRLYHRTVGLNHGNWTTAVWREGINVLPEIVAWCENYISSNPEMTTANYAQIMLATLTAHYGAIPSHYMHYYYFSDRVLEFLQNKPTSRAEDIMATLPEILTHYREEAQKDVPNLTKMRGGGGFGDFALDILNSILNNTGEEWILNVSNRGSVNFLAEDRVVELPCRVDARGATPFTQSDGGIKIEQRGLICQLAEYEGATAQVALWGSRRDAIKALAANPLVLSYRKAEQVYDDLAAAHAQYLPERLLH